MRYAPLSKSTDAGRTWSTSVVLTTPQPILEAEIAGDSQGRLALAYYQLDLSKVTCGSAGPVIPARTFVTVSGDGGAWWNEASAGSANFTGGYWVGEYFGAAATPSGFAVVTIQGTPLAAGGQPVTVTGENSVVVAEVSAR